MRFNISAETVDFVVTFASEDAAYAFQASLVSGMCPIGARDVAAGAFLLGGTVEVIPTDTDAEAPTQRAPRAVEDAPPFADSPVSSSTMPRVEIV